MPELCRFRGIRIIIRFNDHPPPHIHAKHGDSEASVDIATLEVSDGELPVRIERRVIAFVQSHQRELQDAWDLIEQGQNPGKIEPLD